MSGVLGGILVCSVAVLSTPILLSVSVHSCREVPGEVVWLGRDGCRLSRATVHGRYGERNRRELPFLRSLERPRGSPGDTGLRKSDGACPSYVPRVNLCLSRSPLPNKKVFQKRSLQRVWFRCTCHLR